MYDFLAGAGSARGLANLSSNVSARGASAGSSRKPPHIEIDHAAQYDDLIEHNDNGGLEDEEDHGYMDEDVNYDSVEELELIPMSRKHK